jgi:hypothetical protein
MSKMICPECHGTVSDDDFAYHDECMAKATRRRMLLAFLVGVLVGSFIRGLFGI